MTRSNAIRQAEARQAHPHTDSMATTHQADPNQRVITIAFAVRTLLVVALAVANGAFFLAYEKHVFQQRPSSRISNLRLGLTRETVQVRMLLGVQPGPVKCPRGKYRPPGGGTSLGECRFCPRGVYGDSPGLVSSDCTAKCPKGTYQDELGATSVLDCKVCPAGVYGSSPGLTSRACTAPCPYGKYSMKTGLQTMSECEDCPPNYRGPSGRRGNNPFSGTEGGFKCDRFINGKNVVTGRDEHKAAQIDAMLASTRLPHNELIDNTYK